MSNLISVLSRPIATGILCSVLILLSGCGKEETNPKQLGETNSVKQEVLAKASSAFAKALVGTWVAGLPKSHPQYDPSNVSPEPLEYEFTAENTGSLGIGTQKAAFAYSVTGKVITLVMEAEGQTEQMGFSLYSEDMISLGIGKDGANVIFARKGK